MVHARNAGTLEVGTEGLQVRDQLGLCGEGLSQNPKPIEP